MTERKLKFFIEGIIEAIYKIEKYTRDLDFGMFKENELVIDGVIRNLTVIGEASKHIPKIDKLTKKIFIDHKAYNLISSYQK